MNISQGPVIDNVPDTPGNLNISERDHRREEENPWNEGPKPAVLLEKSRRNG